MVVVDGREVVKGGRLLTTDEEAVEKDAVEKETMWRAKKIIVCAGPTQEVGAQWPVLQTRFNLPPWS